MPAHEDARVESWVLGALMDADGPLLRSRASDLLASSGLTIDEFTSPARSAAFKAITALAGSQRPSDAQSVWALCRGMPGVPENGYHLLESLQGASAANREAFQSHAEELRRLSLLRKLEAFHAQQMERLKKPRPNPTELTQALEGFTASFAATTQADETGDVDMHELLDDWHAVMAGKREPYFATGIEVLDEAMDGFVENLNVIGGSPSIGKSALVAEIIYRALERGQRVGLFGLEDATKWLSKRHLSRAMGLPVAKVGAARLHDYQLDTLSNAAGRIASLTSNMLVYRRAGIDPATLVQKCKHWILNKGVQAIFVDHGGEVAHEGGNSDRYDLAVAASYRALRDLAINYHVPVVVLCHFNQDTERQGGIPTMTSFAETAYIARMARVALGLWEKPGDTRLRCTVLKRTEGKRRVTVAIERDAEHALVQRQGGEVIDLDTEREAEQAAQGGRSWKRA